MKRYLYLSLLVLFILSACQPSPAGQGQAATATQADTPSPAPTATSSPTQTPEGLKLIFNSKFPEYNADFTKYSMITLDDFLSGEVLKQEKEYIENNAIFSEEAVPPNKIYTLGRTKSAVGEKFSVNTESLFLENSTRDLYTENPNTRPLKIISYYPVYDIELFDKMGLNEAIEYNESIRKLGLTRDFYVKSLKEKPSFWIVFWANLNADQSISIGHTFLAIDDMEASLEAAKDDPRDPSFMPGFKHTKITYFENPYDDFYNGYTFLDRLWKMYPELKPDETLVNNWIETRQMPDKLEEDLFTYQSFVAYW